jgi:hypothetical protein
VTTSEYLLLYGFYVFILFFSGFFVFWHFVRGSASKSGVLLL